MEWKIKRLKKKILVFKSAKDNDIPLIKAQACKERKGYMVLTLWANQLKVNLILKITYTMKNF